MMSEEQNRIDEFESGDQNNISSSVTKLLRRNLIPAKNLKAIFDDIRNYLAGNAKGMTRDESLTREMINILFCKIFDEKNTENDKIVMFRREKNESEREVVIRIKDRFQDVKREYADVFDEKEEILIDGKSLCFVAERLQNYSITDASREVIGEAFESFITPSLRGGSGQFFTPKNVTKMVVEIIQPKIGEKIIDPACGSGGFLIVALECLWKQIEANNDKNTHETQNEKKEIASSFIRGIDKDSFLAKVTKAYMAIIGDGRGCIFCENSLDPENWHDHTKSAIKRDDFDIVITNPPFGSKIQIDDKNILSSFELGHVWKKENEIWRKTEKLQDTQPPQILFIELCINLLKEGGRMGIVLPDGILSNSSDTYIRQFILNKTKILAIVDCPHETFQPSTATKTSILFLQKETKKEIDADYHIFMSVIERCGHDRRGRENCEDELTFIPVKYKTNETSAKHDRLGFYVNINEIIRGGIIFSPKNYNPEIKEELAKLQNGGNHTLISFGDLVKRNIISVKRGNEIGSESYGTGDIPFVRTSDISNWEIRINPENSVDETVYLKFADAQDIKPGDILFVNDGGRMVGEVAIVTEFDGKMIIQSHIRKIRVHNYDEINPHLLLYLIKLPIVQKQIESKVFVQATIPSLGSRLMEIILPILRDEEKKKEITTRVKEMIQKRAELKKEIDSFINNFMMSSFLIICCLYIFF